MKFRYIKNDIFIYEYRNIRNIRKKNNNLYKRNDGIRYRIQLLIKYVIYDIKISLNI
jgi:hypothetical protein